MKRWAGLLCVALVVASCGSDDSRVGVDRFDRTGDLIVEGYQDFELAARKLASVVDALCAAPEPDQLEAARERWRDARTGWHRTIAFGVGPAMELRTMSAVDFPISTTKVAAIVGGTELVTEESVGELGADARGLGAVEELLFGAGSEALTGPLGARRCQYAAATSGLVGDAARTVLAGWTSGATPHRQTFVADTQGSLEDVYNEVVRTLQGVADRRLARAVSNATSDPDKVDPGAARSALDDMVAELDGVTAMFDALLEPAIARQSKDAADRTRAELDRGRDALIALPRPLATALVERAAGVRAALDSLTQAKRTLATEVAGLLGLTLSFSDSDGDS